MTKKEKLLPHQIVLISSLILIFAETSLAKPGKEHGEDTAKAIGSKDSPGPITVEFLASTGYTLIDKPYDCKKIQAILINKDPPVSFAGRDGIHRILFHWGYDKNASSSKPLKDYLRDEKGLTDEEAGKIIYIINVEWKLRKATAWSAFYWKLPQGNKLKAGLLCEIAYDIHLLGDYEEGSGEKYMASSSDIMASTVQCISKLDESADLTSKLQKANNPGQMLGILKSGLPEVMKRNFKPL